MTNHSPPLFIPSYSKKPQKKDTIKVQKWQNELISCREIADRPGHESVKTTLDTCSHLYLDKDQQLADRLNQFRRAAPAEENP
jgi:hypothetical protein